VYDSIGLIDIIENAVITASKFPDNRSRFPWRKQVDQKLPVPARNRRLMGQRLFNLIQNPVPMERPNAPEVLLHTSREQDTIHVCIIAYANLYVNTGKRWRVLASAKNPSILRRCSG
jgi:hypothetical protein